MKKQKIHINNKEITISLSKNDNDYISLTDMAKFKKKGFSADVVKKWMRNRSTIDFLGLWEKVNNLNFKLAEFGQFKNHAGSNTFELSPQKWIARTNAIGIISNSGRYGGTFAHKDIAFEFASWISPEFKLYLIKEFQRLKTEENERSTLDWSAKRMFTKINYRIHTDAIKEKIILPQELTALEASMIYASEADILNMALFGMTAKDWKEQNPDKEGNIRDYSDVYQLVCLSNLESINAEFIRMNMTQQERILKLNQIAINQMKSLLASCKNFARLLYPNPCHKTKTSLKGALAKDVAVGNVFKNSLYLINTRET